jgi:hypothetical protein
MPKKKPTAFHITCADCDKHYCLKSMTDQVWLMAAHWDCAAFSSVGKSACGDECINDK